MTRAAYDCKAVAKQCRKSKHYSVRRGRAWLDEKGRLKHQEWQGNAKLFPPLTSGQVEVVSYSAGAGWKIAKRGTVLHFLRGTCPIRVHEHEEWEDRAERVHAMWQERIDDAKEVILRRHPNKEIRIYAHIFIRQAVSVLDYFDTEEPYEWCLAGGPRPTRQDIETLLFSLASTAFTAGEYSRALRAAQANRKALRLETNSGRGRNEDAKTQARDDLKDTILHEMRQQRVITEKLPTWRELLRRFRTRKVTKAGRKLQVDEEEGLLSIGEGTQIHDINFNTFRNVVTECRKELQSDAPEREKISRPAQS